MESGAQGVRLDLFIAEAPPFAILPVVHYSYEFAIAAREAFDRLKPAAVALELPAVFEDLIVRGLKRLPRISILAYGNRVKNYIRIEPVDPCIEAGRSALEAGLPIKCIDLAADYPNIFEPAPDTYSLAYVGHKNYCRMLLERPSIRAPEDDARELAMAFYLRELQSQLEKGGPILVVCGASHVKGLLSQLEHSQPRPFDPPQQAKLFHLSSSSLGEVMGAFPFLTSVYELQRAGRTGSIHDSKYEDADDFDRLAPDAAEASKQALVVIDGKKPEALEDFAVKAHRDTAEGAIKRDRHDILTRFIVWSRAYFEREVEERINPQLLFLLENFSRKYARIKNMLLPTFYELLVAGRGCVGSHFCYRMWQIGTIYPPQQGATELEVIELRAKDIFPLVEKVRMNPNAPLRPRAGLPAFLRKRDKQRKPKEEWRFSPFSICSYQPEDVVIEDYAHYLRAKGKSILSEERKRVRPFETSLLDGIDLRETVRNWHTGNIYVQEHTTIKGSVDSLVVIFDSDDRKYPYTMTWLGEHYQESDMAFYATDPEERPAGPGIRKGVYGGLLMTMPPGRLFDVFGDPAYAIANSFAERLLLAAIDYGLERFILYAADKPPRPFFQVIAGRYGKRVLYIPLAQLSPVMVRKIRTFHILSDKSVREYAPDYID